MDALHMGYERAKVREEMVSVTSEPLLTSHLLSSFSRISPRFCCNMIDLSVLLLDCAKEKQFQGLAFLEVAQGCQFHFPIDLCF